MKNVYLKKKKKKKVYLAEILELKNYHLKSEDFNSETSIWFP